MSKNVIEVANGFWNLRGSFKIGGVVDIGTQASLVRRKNGRFVLLDACALTESQERELMDRTRNGEDLEAVLHVHPFHTVFAREMHLRFPKARLFGTARHADKLAGLPWEDLRTEDQALHRLYAEDFDFSVPRGVDFVSTNEHLHFASVLVFHRATKTIHVDDTLMYVELPRLLASMRWRDAMSFHPTLSRVLQKRPGAAAEFLRWANELAQNWRDAENLCAAHNAVLLRDANKGASIDARLLGAIDKVRSRVERHEKKYG